MRILFIFFSLVFCFSVVAQEIDSPSSEITNLICRFQIKGDKLIVTDSITRQINTRSGDNRAEVELYYSKGDKLTVDYAQIEDASGRVVRKLKNKEIQDISYSFDGALYNDDFIKSFELRHNEYPYRISYSYKRVEDQFFRIINRSFTNVRNAKIVVETTFDRPIKYKTENILDAKIDTLANNGLRYTWRFSSVFAPLMKFVGGDSVLTKPSLKILPLNFTYGTQGSWESWQSFGNWVYKLNEGRDVLPESEKQKIGELLNGVTDDREKAKILYYYLQDYNRYVNVKIDVGGFQTYPADYVCRNRYGDCKALSNYMQSILKYAGIKSYYTLIYSDEEPMDIDPDFPSQEFNHVILTVPFEKDTVYLECTSKNMPFGYLPVSNQNRKALLVDESESHLIDMPQLKLDDVICTQKHEVQLNDSEGGLSEFVVKQKGEKYESLNARIAYLNKNNGEMYIRNTLFSGSFDLFDFEAQKAPRDSAFAIVKGKCEFHNLYKQYGNNIVINPILSREIPSQDWIKEKSKKVVIHYPVCYSDTVVYNISGKKIVKHPEDFKLSTPYGECKVDFELKDNSLTVISLISIYSGAYKPDEYDDFIEFVRAVKNNEHQKIYLEVL